MKRHKYIKDDEFKDYFAEIALTNEERAVRLIAGMLVNYLELIAEKNGFDKEKDIKIEGAGCREITIHAMPDKQISH